MSSAGRRATELRSHRLTRVLGEELGGPTPRPWLFDSLMQLLPIGVGGRFRAALLRASGARIGSGTLLFGAISFGAGSQRRNLRLGARCFLNAHIFMDTAAPVTMGDGVSIGHHVSVITTDHEIGPPEFRAGPRAARAVTIGSGAWVAAGVTLLPGVTIGAGAVVAAGAVVTRDVAPNTLVGGIPARLIRELNHE